MTIIQQIITIAVVVLATMLTRFLPFFVFPAGKKIPKFVEYLGKVLPAATLGLLVIYCFKDMQFLQSPYGIPELIASLIVIILHVWKRNMLLSIAAGTVIYMLLVQLVF